MNNQTETKPIEHEATETVATAPAIKGVDHVYACINAIQAELAVEGITKSRKSQGGGSFNFRGIDDIYNALSPIMARHGLVVMPNFEDVKTEVRKSNKGNALYYTTLKGVFTFISAVDGSKTVCSTFGEAMDSGDKSTNKAMSIAYKYAFMQVFCIPTVGDNDPDAYVHEELPYQQAVQKITQPPVDFNNLHNVSYPANEVQAQTPDGKPYRDKACTVRIFNQEQFCALVRALANNQYPLQKFADPSKYYFSQEQGEVLDRLWNYQQNQPKRLG